MKNRLLLSLVLLLLASVNSFGQKPYDPQILVLSPYKTNCAKSLQKEVAASFRKAPSGSAIYRDSMRIYSEKHADNIKEMLVSELAYKKHMDFYKAVSFSAEQFMGYVFFERFPDLMIKLKDSKCDSSISNLKKASEEAGLQYVLNFYAIDLYEKEGVKYADLRVVLYDYAANRIIINKVYTGNWTNPGLEFCCKDHSIECTTNNALSEALHEVVTIITQKSPKVKREEDLTAQRIEALDIYYRQQSNTESLNNIIPATDKSINLAECYHMMFSEDKTRFLAFFLCDKETATLNYREDDKENKRQTSSFITYDENGGPSQEPVFYAYIVKGAMYKDKWYYVKNEITYFNAQTQDSGRRIYWYQLLGKGFFKENSAEYDPRFWDANYFKKVPDLTKESDWDKYGKSIYLTDEMNNRPYIGMYELVANQLKKDSAAEDARQKEQLYQTYVVPLVKKLQADPANESADASQLRVPYVMVYPSGFNTILFPITIKPKGAKKKLRYFVLIRQHDSLYNLFEWHYLDHAKTKKNVYGPDFMDYINTITTWNYSMERFDDPHFWSEYVLRKSDGDFLYLSRIK